MEFEWDEKKRLSNLYKHCLDFIDACDLWNSPMVIAEDTRKPYPEIRYIALGIINNRHVVCAFTTREKAIRISSLRKANTRETKSYEKATKQNRL